MSRVLMIIDPGLQLWGSERALAATLKPLTEAWDRVVLVTPPGAALAGLVADRATHGPVEVIHTPIGLLHKKSRAARMMAVARLSLLLARVRPDKIYLNQAGLCRLLVPLARWVGVPLVLHVRLLEDVPRVAPLRGRVGAPLHQVYISDAMLPSPPPQEDAYTFIHKAYDPYLFAPEDPRAPGGVANFVSLGRLAQSKGQHLLVAAMKDPALNGHAAHIFGEGGPDDPYGVSIKTEAAGQVADGRVVFHGFREDATEALSGYRFLVSTSNFETLGRVVVEAWEKGLMPIVYAGSGGAAEIVRKSGGGLLYCDWTAESLARALRTALEMPEALRAERAARGLNWGRAHLGIDTYQTRLAAVLFETQSTPAS
ncbi:glycosyltransferase family 4 protein (plasmid) [Limimaricola variabilis]|uniref:glycosyltransferase family 4 protein n=1 Tax=Limimaricola variabilis TaxID=1492771 RepID=UPI002AC9658E|nr:glycosyltransferase family 4 protein [Limimaricola variabilis]WPY96232.1 glycosyltransferase family 4 protein [Limimaricola variabilis]